MSTSEYGFIGLMMALCIAWMRTGRNPLLQVALVCILADAGLKWCGVALRAALGVRNRYSECAEQSWRELA